MEENQQDTPQQANPNNSESAFDTHTLNQFGAATEEGSEKSNLTVEDAFSNHPEDTTGTAPVIGQPAPVEETPRQEQPLDAKNDERRYQYWQSQAAQRENEIQALRQQIEQSQTAPATQSPQQPAETVQEFPPPPEAPRKPAGFSREEAWSDSKSASAQYLDEKDAWDNDIGQYNQLKHQYELAVMQEKLDEQSTYLGAQEQQRQNRIEQGRQISQISEHVQGHYGFNPAETQEFIKTMSNPESISMDNLVQLFRMNQASGQQAPVLAGPSDEFRQAKNAQSIPSPMGVMPSQATQDNRDDADKIMDDLINSHKSRNPWT